MAPASTVYYDYYANRIFTLIVYFATDDNGYVKPSFSDTAEDGHVPFNMDDVEAREVTVRIAGGEKIRIVDGVMVTDQRCYF